MPHLVRPRECRGIPRHRRQHDPAIAPRQPAQHQHQHPAPDPREHAQHDRTIHHLRPDLHEVPKTRPPSRALVIGTRHHQRRETPDQHTKRDRRCVRSRNPRQPAPRQSRVRRRKHAEHREHKRRCCRIQPLVPQKVRRCQPAPLPDQHPEWNQRDPRRHEHRAHAAHPPRKVPDHHTPHVPRLAPIGLALASADIRRSECRPERPEMNLPDHHQHRERARKRRQRLPTHSPRERDQETRHNPQPPRVVRQQPHSWEEDIHGAREREQHHRGNPRARPTRRSRAQHNQQPPGEERTQHLQDASLGPHHLGRRREPNVIPRRRRREIVPELQARPLLRKPHDRRLVIVQLIERAPPAVFARKDQHPRRHERQQRRTKPDQQRRPPATAHAPTRNTGSKMSLIIRHARCLSVHAAIPIEQDPLSPCLRFRLIL